MSLFPIFPEDVLVSLDVIYRCWRTVGELDEIDAVESCLRLHELSLLRSYDLTSHHTRLHDVVRGYLRIKAGSTLPTFQKQFLDTYSVSRWADLSSSESYLWKYLIPHLIETQQIHVLLKTTTDLRYLAKKVYVQHSAYAAEADIELAEQEVPSESRLSVLKRQLARFGDLLYACETLQEIESTLLVRVCHLEISRPFLMPWHLLPDTRETALIRTLHGHTGPVNGCAISPDGTWIVSASADKTLKLWDVHTGAIRFTLEGHTTPVTCCAISPLGNRVVSGSEDGTVRIWNAYTGNELLTLSGHQGAVSGCAISPDGTWIVSASADKTLKLWDVRTINELPTAQKYKGSEMRTLRGHKGPVTCCAISPDGAWIASTSEDLTLRIWDTHTGAQLHSEEVLDNGSYALHDCAISPDGSWLVFTYDIGLRIWDVHTRSEHVTVLAHVGTVIGCAISPDGAWMLSTSLDNTLKGWRTDNGLDIFIFRGHADTVNQCAISPRGDWVVSASDDYTLKLWRVPPISMERLPDEEEYAFGLFGCAIDPSGDWAVAVTLNGEMKRWDAHTVVELLTFRGHTGAINACVISPDGKWIVSASDDQTLKTWDAYTWDIWHTFVGHTSAVHSCTINPAGDKIISASDDGTVRVWNVHAPTEPPIVLKHTAAVRGCAVNVHGNIIVSIAGTQIALWDMASGRHLTTFYAHDVFSDCAFHPDGHHLVAAAENGLYFLRIVQHANTV